jgi:hypothetical protein
VSLIPSRCQSLKKTPASAPRNRRAFTTSTEISRRALFCQLVAARKSISFRIPWVFRGGEMQCGMVAPVSAPLLVCGTIFRNDTHIFIQTVIIDYLTFEQGFVSCFDSGNQTLT